MGSRKKILENIVNCERELIAKNVKLIMFANYIDVATNQSWGAGIFFRQLPAPALAPNSSKKARFLTPDSWELFLGVFLPAPALAPYSSK